MLLQRLGSDELNLIRAVALWITRAVSVALVALGLFHVMVRIVMTVLTRDGSNLVSNWMGDGHTHGVFRGCAMMGAGIVIGAASRPLTRWIIATPEDGCARCDHARSTGIGEAAGVCPECGFHHA